MTFSIYRKLGAPVFSLCTLVKKKTKTKKKRNKTRIFLPLLMFLTHRAKLLIRGKKSNLQHLTILLVNTWWNVLLGRVCFGLSCLCLACLIWLTYTLVQLTNKNTMKITKIQYLLKNLRKIHLFPCYYFFLFVLWPLLHFVSGTVIVTVVAVFVVVFVVTSWDDN